MLWFAHRPPQLLTLNSVRRGAASDTFSFPEAISGDSAFKARPWGSWIETQPSQQFLDHRYHDPKSSILSVWLCAHQMGDSPGSHGVLAAQEGHCVYS